MVRRARTKHDLPEYTQALNDAHSGAGPAPDCDGLQSEFADYSIEDLPSKSLAELMCERCPLLDICNKNARHVRPNWGVVGGIAWVEGRQAHLMKANDPRLTVEFHDTP